MGTNGQTEIKKSICHWCGHACRVDLYVENGRLVKQTEDVDHSLANMYKRTVRSCPRAQAAADIFYHPSRLNYPQKRVGERGEGKWEQISWEQAMDEIAAKLADIKKEYGPGALASTHGTGRTVDEYRRRFMNLFGSPNVIGQGHICFGPGMSTGGALQGAPSWAALRGETKCLLAMGYNPEQSFRQAWWRILELKRAGMKLIVGDPRRTPMAQNADVWLQLRPGTDCAMYMGIANVIISEGLYDKEFVDKWCYGFDKFAERMREYPVEKVAEITWVPVEKIVEAARIFASSKPSLVINGMGLEHLSNSIEASMVKFGLEALTGSIDVKGGEFHWGFHPNLIEEHTIELNEMLPPEEAQKQLGVERFRWQARPGYELVSENVKKVSGGRMWGLDNIYYAHAPSVYRAMLTGEPNPVRAMITLSSNPMVTQGNTKLVYKALKSLDLYVVVDYWMTPSADIADYVLPAATWYERPHIWNWWDQRPFIEAAEQALPKEVEGEYDRWDDFDVWRGLGIRLGQEEHWPWKTLEEALDYRMASFGMTLKEFVAQTGGSERPHKVGERKYETRGFATTTGKFEFYSTVAEKLGYDPLPQYYEPAESPISTPELAKEYPFVLTTGQRHEPFFHSEHRQIDRLRQLHPDPLVLMHPKAASGLGIDDGDWVWIETLRGRVRQRCQYYEGMDPRVVAAQHGWWFPELPGEEPWLHGVWESNINVCTDDNPDVCGRLSGGWPLRALLCKVYKAKVFPGVQGKPKNGNT